MNRILATIVLAVASTSAFAATAYWNGEQTNVTTVTYQQGVRCGYNYNGRIFYATFVGFSCPSSINIQ